MILLDLFSGTGGFPLGLQNAGFKISKHYYSEINQHAIANFKYNFQDSIYVGAISEVYNNMPTRADVITLGSPCQDFSKSGSRKGLKGKKSVLLIEAIRIIKKQKPRVFIWENVKGSFTSNARADFWAVVKAFADIGDYRIQWQLLNSIWLLPQRRERIYLVGIRRGTDFGNVFPILSTDSRPESRYTWTSENVLVRGLTESRTEEARALRRKYQKLGIDLSPRRKKKVAERNDSVIGTITATNSIGQLISIRDPEDLYPPDIRYLTQLERERLQGFPDNWTKYGLYKGEVQKLLPSYRNRLIGNAVSVPVVTEIGLRLLNNAK